MKHPLLESFEIDYPVHLERHHDHILQKVEALWDKPEIDDYLSDLLMDKRGGRKGFNPEVTNEIVALREYRMLETFRVAERREAAVQELSRRGIFLGTEGFLRALRDGNQEIVDLFVRANFNIHWVDDDGTPPLLFALKRGYTVIAKILLNAGADVNERDKLGLTPLLVACGKSTRGYKEVVEILLKKGAQVNVRDTLGYTPLLLSLSGGTFDIAKLLLEKHADIAVHTRKGETPLSLAQNANSAGAAEIVDLLISKGAAS